MFGFSKLYERKFEPYDTGYSYQALTGSKFVSPEERDKLVSSYRDSLKIDFLGLFKAMLVALAIIAAAALTTVLFVLPESVLDAAMYIGTFPIFIIAFRSTWKHLKKSHQILSLAPALQREGSWFDRLGTSWHYISWMRIVIVLPIFGFLFFLLVRGVWASPTNWLLLSLAIVLGLGLINLCFAAIWKIVKRPRVK